jgi:hypothetical protein
VILKQKSGARNWALQSYPGKVRLPADVFAPAQDPEEQKRVLQRAYLPDETVAWFGEQGKVAIKVGSCLVQCANPVMMGSCATGEAEGRS